MWSFLSIRTGLIAALIMMMSVPVLAQQGTAPNDEDAIRDMLEQRDAEIKSILDGDRADFTDEQRNELMTLINGVIDFRAMGQHALGPFWGDLSEEQRDEFVDVFRDVVRLQSMADLEVYNSEVSYEHIDVEGDSAFVRTITRYQGTQTPVDYVLARQGDTWLAQDIIVDEVSTAEGYARSFQRVMRRRGFDSLMNSLEQRRERAQQESQEQSASQ